MTAAEMTTTTGTAMLAATETEVDAEAGAEAEVEAEEAAEVEETAEVAETIKARSPTTWTTTETDEASIPAETRR